MAKAEPAVRGSHSSSAISRLYQPYPGVDRRSQPADTSMAARYASTPAYAGPAGVQQSGLVKSPPPALTRGYRSGADADGQMYFDRSRNMTISSSRPTAATEHVWNNQPAPSVSFIITALFTVYSLTIFH